MKPIYRVLILVAIYIGAVIFFANGMTERIFGERKELTPLSSPTFPTVTIKVGDEEMNVLHGYASNLNEMIMRESITPLDSDRTFTLIIDENESLIKKLKYEILDENGIEVESDSMIVLDTGEEQKTVKIRTHENLKNGVEYVAKITLITNQSRRIYYYTRLKLYDDGHMTEKLDFAKGMHESMFDGLLFADYEKYFEPSKKSDNTSFASVNIHSSKEMLTYGDLNPTIEFEAAPTVTEFYETMASVMFDYVISVDTEYGKEMYRAKEKIRFGYSATRMYLYNYERTMEVIYNPEHVSLNTDEVKIGITDKCDIQTICNKSGTYFAFVADRRLMLYDSTDNKLISVFSFRQDTGDYLRDLYDQHDVRIIKVSEEGDIDFYVCGYMNRGEYEGRVGILLYRFNRAEMYIEEQAYLPVSSSYQLLRYDIGDFIYRNDLDVFYFTMYDTIYAYNIASKKLQTIANDVPRGNLVFCEEENYVAWQNKSDVSLADEIIILDLETGSRIVVSSPIGENIRMFGRINNNIVYGFSTPGDEYSFEDGNSLIPAHKLLICNGKGSVLKEYEKPGFYIVGIEEGDNDIYVMRMTKNESTGRYTEAEGDYVMNRRQESTDTFKETKRVTERLLTEYYISFPETVDIVSKPTQTSALVNVIREDATVRVVQTVTEDDVYYAYSFGEVVLASSKASKAITTADAAVGTVINSEGKLVWERGVKSPKREITDIEPSFDNSLTSMQNCMKMLLAYKNVEANAADFDRTRTTAAKWLGTVMKSSPVELTDCTLDEVLYYVYRQRPVIVETPSSKVCLITAYDQTAVTLVEPASGRIARYQYEDAEALFTGAGNRFLSYLD